ncbi:MAG: HEAT repeat domain-containing protein [Kofleriaceae bacterium]
MARPPNFDLARELAKPNFTPGRSDAAALVELVISGAEDAAARASAALAGLEATGRSAVAARFDTSDEAARARMVNVFSLLARRGDPEATTRLLELVGSPASRVRRAAILALGKLGGDAAAAVLTARWDAADIAPDERRALTEALGKIGGEPALQRLRMLEPGGDAELARRRDRALLMADRSAKRAERSAIATNVPPPHPLDVRLSCRAGLAELLHRELQTVELRNVIAGAPRIAAHDTVAVRLVGPWDGLFRSRLWASAAIYVPFTSQATSADELASRITRILTTGTVPAVFRAWTNGAIRWRLDLARGQRKSLVWRVARDVTAAAPDLINDPTQTTWDVVLDLDTSSVAIVPRRAHDPRFDYRVADVPAASHPTVAAALAFVAEARAHDRVWDPFCGSGVELVERARLGPLRSLIGSDLAAEALAAARNNLAAAGVLAELEIRDARDPSGDPVDAIITNPPLGSRVQLDAAELLIAALPAFARRLAPGGRLVWITPNHRKTGPVAERLGLTLAHGYPVDLGGVRGRVERWNKR